jgi:hypothetical protein
LPQLLCLLEQLSSLGWREDEEYSSGFGSRALPSVRDAPRYEGACAGSADSDLIADLEGHFPAQHVSHFIAIPVKVEIGLVPGGPPPQTSSCCLRFPRSAA